MSKHLSREQLEKYTRRELQPGELIAVDGHLTGCEDCRKELAELVSPADSMLSAIRHATSEHLTYEQMDAWVEDELDQSERELVSAHIDLCLPCTRQLKAYESYAPVMSAPIAPPASPAHSFADRIRAWFRIPQVAMGAAAVAIALILGPIILLNGPNKTDSASLAQLDQLPTSIQAGARAVVAAKSVERPEALAGLAPNADPDLSYPVSEVVEERQPILHWNSFGGAYDVALFDSEHREVAQASGLNDNHWLVPMQLTRGAVYIWEVRAAGQSKSASFRVLDSADEAQLTEVRNAKVGSLALGAVAQQLGLLSLAQSEFRELAKEQPKSKEAEKLLNNVNSLRGR
ncbi:MAG TPA: zf-HC2 domain-containing protein [Bryobacteraceae bacterium]|nr:zf-HC2 domain-containing protein [Bryobacteraceae bacterium]